MTEPTSRPIALVTGASSGIGRAFAEQLAAGGHDLVLVARDAARLDALSAELRSAHGIAVEIVVADLVDLSARRTLVNRLADLDRPVDLLINNAGDTIPGSLLDTAPERLRAHVALNVGAVVALTTAATRRMAEQGSGAVLNVSSVNCFVAVPGAAAVYGAGKLCVTVLTECLAGDLRRRGVRAMVLCPGLTRTEFGERNGGATIGADGPARSWSPDAMARHALADLARHRVVSVPGRRFRRTAALGTLLPYRPLGALPALARRPPVPAVSRAVIVGVGAVGAGPVGAAFGRRLAADGVDLVLVDPDPERLAALARELPGTAARTVVADPADPVGRAELCRILEDPRQPVDLLVLAGPAPSSGDVEAELLGVLEPVRSALRGMRARGGGAVVHVGDARGLLPGRAGDEPVRAAVAAFAVSLVRGLAVELATTGVRVLAACPGPGTDPAAVAERALADLGRRRVVSVHGRHRLAAAAARTSPRALWRRGARRSGR